MRPGTPLTKQKSPWEPSEEDAEMVGLLKKAGSAEVAIFLRWVSDGHLRAIRSQDDGLWHLSVSHWPRKATRAPRYPSWDELAHARYELLPQNVNVCLYLPPPDQFVNVSDTTFHLWEVGDGKGRPALETEED